MLTAVRDGIRLDLVGIAVSTILAPILTSFFRSLVNDQRSTSFGNARVRFWLTADIDWSRYLRPLSTPKRT